ncbi:low temperature requirement protein A [Galbitalea sp. SE-J8]|uniref:low temperature requirement protein A n=1 Tax=Galbitalea sp. SE-J8 TaxID=3054952 RepID=UPI00259CA59B|nr:low temperature requirement protein A [Galbitalea sp. SE-J8]MDM4763968.1 low temperature requirement protein A [Galbitalea sp. SE-J8]
MVSLRTRMVARDTTERHRASTPLELLVDLVFVVAVSQLAAALAETAEHGHPLDGVVPFAMVFFAIWWAWMNFTWFASAYDTDDVGYRLLTLVQMAGALIIAAGVPGAFEQHFDAVTIGYLVMRIGLVAQWVRAGAQHPAGRATAWRYAAGISVVQALWLTRLALPHEAQFWTFFVCAVLDVAVPIWAERTGGTAWHPHHIAERYGLFVIILLGESVLAATVAFAGAERTVERVVIGLAGLVILFALWWVYFLHPVGEDLERRPSRSYLWGYGHYVLFAALAAVGAGLEVAVVVSGEPDAPVGDRTVAVLVGLPLAVALATMWLLQLPLGARSPVRGDAVALAAGIVLSAAIAVPLIGLVGAFVAMVVVLVLLVASTYLPRDA